MSFSVPGNFFGQFKTGDNIVYNLSVLRVLYTLYNQSDDEEKALIIKPIIILLVAIIEAILHDFHSRMRVFTIEGVEGLVDGVLDYVRGKRIDELEKYIASARMHDFFDASNTRLYDMLDELRKIRNRVHIQNVKGYKPVDEVNVFTEDAKIKAEKCLEKVTKVMSEKYYRGGELGRYVQDLEFPWDEHFPNI